MANHNQPREGTKETVGSVDSVMVVRYLLDDANRQVGNGLLAPDISVDFNARMEQMQTCLQRTLSGTGLGSGFSSGFGPGLSGNCDADGTARGGLAEDSSTAGNSVGQDGDATSETANSPHEEEAHDADGMGSVAVAEGNTNADVKSGELLAATATFRLRNQPEKEKDGSTKWDNTEDVD
ncbi:hypothetical protein MKZ38_009354 [Zalerion maritima]|uniref:Uncharacterized protein n=1 Tax=Zalerion maritima TaxID=339359 RepID=A0AAD5RTI0_9PEZI|nr:hypothetical protein MKZ38_009354 [Zalerion maritima]